MWSCPYPLFRRIEHGFEDGDISFAGGDGPEMNCVETGLVHDSSIEDTNRIIDLFEPNSRVSPVIHTNPSNGVYALLLREVDDILSMLRLRNTNNLLSNAEIAGHFHSLCCCVRLHLGDAVCLLDLVLCS